jgi:hypothetical protein
MGFKFFTAYYGYYVGVQVQGTIGKSYTYRIQNGKQQRYPYTPPPYSRTPGQDKMRILLKNAVLSWKALSQPQKNYYTSLEPFKRIQSGYNYYIGNYIKTYL